MLITGYYAYYKNLMTQSKKISKALIIECSKENQVVLS